jgi:hypothetical protein
MLVHSPSCLIRPRRRASLHAHALRRTPGPGSLARDLAAEAAAQRAALEGLEAGLAAQVNALDQLLEVAASRQSPWQRPIATRIARGQG